jgi:signal peptidase II
MTPKSLVCLQLLIFSIVFGFDRVSKYYLDVFLKTKKIGPIFFEAHSNPGLILQTLTDASFLSRIVFVSSIYGFIFFAFFLIQYFLNGPFIVLRVSITIFFASITSNAFDRAFNGAVSDFICFNMLSKVFYFNFADAFMWVALIVILIETYRFSSLIWYPKTQRKKHLINYSYQLKRAFQIALTSFSSALALTLFSYTYFMHSENLKQEAQPVFFICSISIGIVFSLVTFFAGVLFSHRSAGPIYAFESYVNLLLDGKNTEFFLRRNDEHQGLVSLAKRLKEHFVSTTIAHEETKT